jgi:hypothetical protein
MSGSFYAVRASSTRISTLANECGAEWFAPDNKM